MDRRERYAAALGLACHICGSRDAMARYLAVAPDELEGWLAGEAEPPLEAFMSALDVIAYGPTAVKARALRVAVIRTDEERGEAPPATN